MGNIDTTVTITAAAAKRLVAAYNVSDKTLAARVVLLAPFTGKGHGPVAVFKATEAHNVRLDVKPATISAALTVARAMVKTKHLGEDAAITASARDGIAAALLRIVRAPSAVGGGAKGMTAAYAAAIDAGGTTVDVAERVTIAAENVADAAAAARRAPKTRAAQVPTGEGETAETTEPDTAESGTTAAPAEAAPAPLASHSVRALLAEINARVVAGYVLTNEEDALLAEIGANVEEMIAA